MSFLKKQGAGFYLTALTLAASAVGLCFYLVNCGTDYFRSMGSSPVVWGCALLAIAAQAAYLLLSGKQAADLLPVVSGAALVVALVSFISARISGIAAIMTFTNNAQNMADLSSAIIGIAALLIAVVLNAVASFFEAAKA